MARKLWYGPLWPLPRSSPRTAITSGLPAADLESSEYYEAAAMDVIVSTPNTNTGNVYLVIADASGNFDKDNDGTVVMVLGPGSSRNIAQAAYAGNKYKLSDLGIDVDGDYVDTYYVCAIMQ